MNIPTLTKNELYELLSSRFHTEDKKLADIPNPALMYNAPAAAKKIVEAIRANKKITLVGDYDVDGVSSTAIVVDFFRQIPYPLEAIIPNRFRDGYGVSPNVLERIDSDLIITVDNGIINFEVLEKKSDGTMTCKVIDGGILKSKRHVNLPGIRVNLPAITKKDKMDILFALEHQVDFIALSFVREAADIAELKELLGDKIGKIKIIAKIEAQSGVKNLEEILEAADGIMVARGDLGVEINVAEMPNVQRRIVRLCAERGKRVIVATHLLESMIENPIPTRAEVTDVANAIYEEVDAVMLSGETTVGKHPVRCVEQLVEIAVITEAITGLEFTKKLQHVNDKQSLAVTAVDLAESLSAKGIVVITRRGFMADYVTNCHPQNTRIYAFTNDSQTRRRLILNRNLSAFRSAFSQDPEKTLQTAFDILKKKAGLNEGDKIVVISDVLAGTGIEAIQIRQL